MKQSQVSDSYLGVTHLENLYVFFEKYLWSSFPITIFFLLSIVISFIIGLQFVSFEDAFSIPLLFMTFLVFYLANGRLYQMKRLDLCRYSFGFRRSLRNYIQNKTEMNILYNQLSQKINTLNPSETLEIEMEVSKMLLRYAQILQNLQNERWDVKIRSMKNSLGNLIPRMQIRGKRMSGQIIIDNALKKEVLFFEYLSSEAKKDIIVWINFQRNKINILLTDLSLINNNVVKGTNKRLQIINVEFESLLRVL